jgi:hypothetical protein
MVKRTNVNMNRKNNLDALHHSQHLHGLKGMTNAKTSYETSIEVQKFDSKPMKQITKQKLVRKKYRDASWTGSALRERHGEGAVSGREAHHNRGDLTPRAFLFQMSCVMDVVLTKRSGMDVVLAMTLF